LTPIPRVRCQRSHLRIASQLLLSVALISSTASQQRPSPAPEKRKQIEDGVKKFMDSNALPGISVAVVEEGAYQWSSGFGMSDLENSVPATSTTLYRLGSISKTITATAAMVLYERDKLDLDAPVQNYCPAFPKKHAPITTRQLLGHLGGIRHDRTHSFDDPEVSNTKHVDDPISGGLDFFKNDPLVATPGTKFSYSTNGYTVVGCVIEGVSGMKYVDFVRENVLRPAGMTHTQVDDYSAIIPNRTRFYSCSPDPSCKDKSGVINSRFVDTAFKTPGDGWLSSAEDMAKFEVALLNGHLVSAATRKLLWTRQKTSDGKETPYGLGWAVDDLIPSTVSHGGGEWGTSTFIMISPERRAGVVVMINLNGGNANDLGVELFQIILGSKQLPAN
jgi:serine beta-lactamase-like protein LACTB